MPLLAREYREGLPLGSSIFIKDKNNIYLTGLERQCFLKAGKGEKIGHFAGVQWLPYTFFPSEVYQNIENDLLKIGRELAKSHLSGLVGLDFVLDKKGVVNFIECNPRTTDATPQIMTFKELRGREDFLKLILNHYIKSFKYKSRIPRRHFSKSLFAGAQIHIYFPNFKNFPIKVKKIKSGGFFVLKNGKLKRISLNNRFDFPKLKNGLFYYSEINEREIYNYNKNVLIGVVISNFPLYDFETGDFNKNGKIVYKFFSENEYSKF